MNPISYREVLINQLEINFQDKKIIYPGVVILTFIAGFINVVSILGINHYAVSHLTGNASFFAIELSKSSTIFDYAIIIFAFFLGSIFSGITIGSIDFDRRKRYGLVLLLESFLLAWGTYLFLENDLRGDYFLAFACGMQNALAMTYKGSLIRLTHITGTVTDLGAHIGNIIRGNPPVKWKIYLSLLQIFGFSFGAYSGGFLYGRIDHQAMWIPVILCAMAGGSFFTWRTFFSDLKHHVVNKFQ